MCSVCIAGGFFSAEGSGRYKTAARISTVSRTPHTLHTRVFVVRKRGSHFRPAGMLRTYAPRASGICHRLLCFAYAAHSRLRPVRKAGRISVRLVCSVLMPCRASGICHRLLCFAYTAHSCLRPVCKAGRIPVGWYPYLCPVALQDLTVSCALHTLHTRVFVRPQDRSHSCPAGIPHTWSDFSSTSVFLAVQLTVHPNTIRPSSIQVPAVRCHSASCVHAVIFTAVAHYSPDQRARAAQNLRNTLT